MRFAIALMKPLIKPLSEGLSRQKTAAKSLLIPFGKMGTGEAGSGMTPHGAAG